MNSATRTITKLAVNTTSPRTSATPTCLAVSAKTSRHADVNVRDPTPPVLDNSRIGRQIPQGRRTIIRRPLFSPGGDNRAPGPLAASVKKRVGGGGANPRIGAATDVLSTACKSNPWPKLSKHITPATIPIRHSGLTYKPNTDRLGKKRRIAAARTRNGVNAGMPLPFIRSFSESEKGSLLGKN